MKCSYTIFVSTLLGGGVFAAVAANSKLNQYASLSDCQSDSNIISHASPAEGSCHGVDSRTGALYLVTGSDASGAKFQGCDANNCSGNDLGFLAEGSCITPPDGINSIIFLYVA